MFGERKIFGALNMLFRLIPILIVLWLYGPTPARSLESAVQVCVGPVNAHLREFKFQIHPVKGECATEEKKFDVKQDKDGILLLFPSDVARGQSPSSPSLPQTR
jgi:hypothetical protein